MRALPVDPGDGLDWRAGDAMSMTRPPQDEGLIRVPVGKGGCYLLLTDAEYDRGIRRGKWARRRATMEQRLARIPASGASRGDFAAGVATDISDTLKKGGTTT